MVHWFDRENWYRMVDREPQCQKATLAVGTVILATRVIVRCGYYWEHMDCPIEDQNQLAIELMGKRLNLPEEECQRIVMGMRQYEYRSGHYTLERHLPAFSFTGMHAPLHGLYYRVRHNWSRSQPAYPDTSPDLRTLWYVDVPEPYTTFDVLGKDMRMIGTPYWEDEDGSFFAERGRQQLYRVRDRSMFLRHRSNRHLHSNWYVHPEDAREQA